MSKYIPLTKQSTNLAVILRVEDIISAIALSTGGCQLKVRSVCGIWDDLPDPTKTRGDYSMLKVTQSYDQVLMLLVAATTTATSQPQEDSNG